MGEEGRAGAKEVVPRSLILSSSVVLCHEENADFGFGLESLNPGDERLAGTWRLNCCSAHTSLHFKRPAVCHLHSSAFVI